MGFMERLSLRAVVKAGGLGVAVARKAHESNTGKVESPVVTAGMQATAETALAQIAARTEQFESSFKPSPKKNVSQKAADLQKALVSLDTKYSSLSPAVVEARVKDTPSTASSASSTSSPRRI